MLKNNHARALNKQSGDSQIRIARLFYICFNNE